MIARLFVSTALGLSSAAAMTAQVPVRDLPTPRPAATPAVEPAPAGKGSITGFVTNDDPSPARLRMATVVLIGTTTGIIKLTSTDHDGRFTFGQLPVDRFTLAASKLPYLGAMAGARRPMRPGTPIAVADGQAVTDVAIRLPRSAAISGVLTDHRGRPATSVGVGVQPIKMVDGVRVLAPAFGMVFTDSAGRYRIHSLPPGAYLVVGMPLGGVSAEQPTLTDDAVDAVLRGGTPPPRPVIPPRPQSTTLVPVYFPGTARPGDALPVTVAPGDDRTQVDFQMQQATTARVEGTVATADGQPVELATALLTYGAMNPLQSTRSTRITAGRFSFTGVPPGSYTLQAQVAGTSPMFGTVPVEVSGTDVGGVHVTVRPPLTLNGRLVIEDGTAVAALNGRRIPFTSFPQGPAPQVRPADATGAFTVTGVAPGRYLIGGPTYFGAGSESVTLALQTVHVDGKDASDLPVDISAEAPPKEIVMTFGDRWQQLSGRLANAGGEGLSAYAVVMFPAAEAHWFAGSRRIAVAQTGSDGYFALGGPGPSFLPAGEYYLAAVTDIAKDEQFDPAFLQSITGTAIKVTLQPGEKRRQDLVIR